MIDSIKVKAGQIAYFLGTIDLSDRLKLATSLKGAAGDILNGSPTILPVPDDAPLEIPRVLFPSRDNSIVCNIAANRLDLIYKTAENEEGISIEDFEKSLTQIVDKLNSFLFLDEVKASPFRLGIIINYRAYPKEGALTFLKKRFLGDHKDSSSQLEFHKLHQTEINDMKTNHWTRLIATNQNPTQGDSLLIVSDINTLQHEKYDIDADSSSTFFKQSFKIACETAKENLVEGN